MTAPKLRPSRASGVLLHPTSLPNSTTSFDLGMGDLGPAAYSWVDSLAAARQSWWQILPLGPTGASASPYQSYSAFAGNPNLISPERLASDGLLRDDEYGRARFSSQPGDYLAAITFKEGLLDRAWENFRARAAQPLKSTFEQFCVRHARWLDDYGLFMALKETRGGDAWLDWPEPLRVRRPAALEGARRELGEQIDHHRFKQFLFFRQWDELKAHARARGLKLIGDIPIFVAGDSADVWANPHLFLLGTGGRPAAVAGVPPDYFSPTGQLWGNPLYNWEAMRRDGYAWWADRVRMALTQVDTVRVDHFRGFSAAWHVPANAPTAQSGAWVAGPGADLFRELQRQLGSLPLIAEDLGVITPDVERLRDELGLPGMRVLQFAFGEGPENRYLPHHYDFNCVAYTGTHDNDTTRGWYARQPEYVRDHVRRYLGRDGSDVAWDFIRSAWASPADLAITPLQDILNLGSEGRMNTPGVAQGNWRWRVPGGMMREASLHGLAELTVLYGRVMSAE